MGLNESPAGVDAQNSPTPDQEPLRKQIRQIIGGLKSRRPEEFQPALAAAEQMLADEPTMGPTIVALLLATQQEIHPIEGSPYPALNQIYGLLVDKVFDHWLETQQIPEILVWYDEQTDYDGIVFNRHLDSISRRQWPEDTRILIALFSDNPSAVKSALRQVDFQFFYSPSHIGYPNVSFLIALKAILDKRDSLGDAPVDEAQKLLMKGILRNQGFLDYSHQDIKLLVEWYYQQEECQPLDRYPKSVIEDANRLLASEVVTEALLRKDITAVCNQYRDCLSYLWNTFFRHDDIDLFENFEDILFATLVRNRGDWLAPDYVYRSQMGYLPDLRVRPKLSAGKLSILWLPDPSLHYRRWEETTLTADTIDIRFKDYFDWDMWGYRTWEYIEGWVVAAPDQPELEQKAVLIKAQQANIIYDQSCVVDIPAYTIETVLDMPLPRSQLPVFYHYSESEKLIGTDVTAACERYRECARHLWQTYFRQSENRASSFDEIDRELFATMVLSQIDRAADSPVPGVTPIPYLRVVPNIDHSRNQEPFAVIYLHRVPGVRFGEWREIQLGPNTTELWFKGYWDPDVDQAGHWSPDDTSHRTWRYIRARIARAPDQPEFVGEDVIVEPSQVRIKFNPDWS
ncbi:MAG: hypothetical protein KDI79_11365 [Anaerolineae bacterium]|nr:hypothetical protein [Anaerolineae bacterium]